MSKNFRAIAKLYLNSSKTPNRTARLTGARSATEALQAISLLVERTAATRVEVVVTIPHRRS